MQAKGFTVFELMVALAIAAILLSLSVPSLTPFIQNNRSATQINELHAALSLARSEAVKRIKNITLCKSTNGTDCGGDAVQWHQGWIVFVDNDFDGTVDGGDEILLVHGIIPGGITLTFTQTRVLYARNGLADGGSQGAFTLCDARGAASAKGLIIGPSGRPRLATDSDSDGILEDGNNVDLVCSS